MERPYVICHMLSSLDGKIDGGYMSMPENVPVRGEYGRLREFFGCQATLYGTVTMQGSYSAGLAPESLPDQEKYPRKDYIAKSDVENYIISLDPQGILGWNAKYIEKKGRPKAHVVEVLTEQVSGAYLSYLQKFDISYLFAGKKTLDCALLLQKLKTSFGIKRLMIAGGGVTNWSFLQAGVLDELSLVISPVADGNTTSVSIFEWPDFLPVKPPVAFTLKEVKKLKGDGIWLRYTVKERGKAGYEQLYF